MASYKYLVCRNIDTILNLNLEQEKVRYMTIGIYIVGLWILMYYFHTMTIRDDCTTHVSTEIHY